MSESITKSGLERAYLTTLLLSGKARLAEDAVTEAINSLDPGEMSDQSLFLEAIKAALAPAPAVRVNAITGFGRPASLLPIELRRILGLPAELRQPFVLRTLAALSLERCQRLLHITIEDVDRRNRAAFVALAVGCQLQEKASLMHNPLVLCAEKLNAVAQKHTNS